MTKKWPKKNSLEDIAFK